MGYRHHNYDHKYEIPRQHNDWGKTALGYALLFALFAFIGYVSVSFVWGFVCLTEAIFG